MVCGNYKKRRMMQEKHRDIVKVYYAGKLETAPFNFICIDSWRGMR